MARWPRRSSISDSRATWRTSSYRPAKIPSSHSKTPRGFATHRGNMKSTTLSGLILLGLLLFIAANVSVLAEPQPIQSPEVHPDRSVTFRFRAPNAKEVALDLEGAKGTPMEKDEQGVWSATTGPLDPDFYGYSFSVDGVSLHDPSNPAITPNLLSVGNSLHVPGPASLPWEVN